MKLPVIPKSDIMPSAWRSSPHSPGHKAGIDVDHGENGAGLEHGVQGRLSASAQAVAGGDRQAYHRCLHQSGHHRWQRPPQPAAITRASAPAILSRQGEDAVNSGHAHIVLVYDGAAHLLRHHPRLLRSGHIDSMPTTPLLTSMLYSTASSAIR